MKLILFTFKSSQLGAYALLTPESHMGLISRILEETRLAMRQLFIGSNNELAPVVKALLVDYRKSPEHPFPAGVLDVIKVWDWLTTLAPTGYGLTSTHPRCSEVIVGGDSAGGGLTMALVYMLRHRSLMRPASPCKPLQPAATILISPCLELHVTGKDHPLDYVHQIHMVLLTDWYLLGNVSLNQCTTKHARTSAHFKQFDFTNLCSPEPLLQGLDNDFLCSLASPVNATELALVGLPPTLLQVGGLELFRGPCEVFAQRAQQAGSRVNLQIFEHMPHVHQAFAGCTPLAANAVEKIGAFIASQVGKAKRFTDIEEIGGAADIQRARAINAEAKCFAIEDAATTMHMEDTIHAE
jgi:acetyl esterase/lipase